VINVRVKRLKRMCSVKGCNCTDTYAISKTSEFGGVIICEECIRQALAAIDSGGIYEPEKKGKPYMPLFHHPEYEAVREALHPYTGGMTYACATCGKEFKSAIGLIGHMKVHEPKGGKKKNESGEDVKPHGVSGADGEAGNAGEGVEG
jgi:hypothetical protein